MFGIDDMILADAGSALLDSFMADLGSSAASTAAASGSSMVPAALAGGASLAGSVMTNSTNKALANQQMQFSAQQASSIYQRGSADMIAAGLNPILAYANPAQVASYQQPQIQNSLAIASQAATSAYQAHTQGEANKATAYSTTETGHTTKATRPGQVQQIGHVNEKLLSEIEAISFGNALTQANTAKVSQETKTSAALEASHTAQAAESKQRALTSATQEALNRTMEKVQEGQLTIQKVQQIVMYADAALKSSQAKQALSADKLNAANAALSDMNKSLAEAKRQNIEPEAKFNRDFPRFSESLAGMREVFRSIPGLSILMKEGLVP
jgi:hypothetical protein